MHTDLSVNYSHLKHTEKLLLKHTVIKMTFIKEEREEMKIEEDFNHEDTETQTGLFHSQSLSSVMNLFIVFTTCNS